MTDLVSFVFSVGGAMVALLAGVLWIGARPHSPRARRFTLAVAIAYTLATIYAVPFMLTRLLLVGLDPFVTADLPAGRSAIVVMGSGSYTITDWSGREYSTANPIAASRVLEAVRVFELVDPAWVISSGGKRRPEDPAEATGSSMARLLRELGVPAERLITDTSSRNTHDESVVVAAMLPRLNVQHLIVVTSDAHMRRSLGAFRAAGVRAIPAIAREPFPPRSAGEWILPREQGLWLTSQFAHETLGIAYYAARGWYQ